MSGVHKKTLTANAKCDPCETIKKIIKLQYVTDQTLLYGSHFLLPTVWEDSNVDV